MKDQVLLAGDFKFLPQLIVMAHTGRSRFILHCHDVFILHIELALEEVPYLLAFIFDVRYVIQALFEFLCGQITLLYYRRK